MLLATSYSTAWWYYHRAVNLCSDVYFLFVYLFICSSIKGSMYKGMKTFL